MAKVILKDPNQPSIKKKARPISLEDTKTPVSDYKNRYYKILIISILEAVLVTYLLFK